MSKTIQALAEPSVKSTAQAKLVELFEEASIELRSPASDVGSLGCFACQGCLITGHDYILTIVAMTKSPLAPAESRWRCLGDLDTASPTDLQTLAGTFCAGSSTTKLQFISIGVLAEYAQGQLQIVVHAQPEARTGAIMRSLSDRVYADLKSLLSDQQGEIQSLSVLLMPPEKAHLH